MTLLPFALLLLGATLAYFVNRRAAVLVRSGGAQLHSNPGYHGLFAALSVVIPLLAITLIWMFLDGAVIERLILSSVPKDAVAVDDTGAISLILAEIQSLADGRVFGEPEPWKVLAAERLNDLRATSGNLLIATIVILSIGILALRRTRLRPELRARQGSERLVHGLMVFCSVVAILTTIGIVSALLFETIKFLNKVPLTEFLFGLNWEPQIPIREDQVAASGAFGWIPVLVGTLVVTVVALAVAVPTGLFAAVYLNEFAHRRFRAVAKPVLEILAGVPTVVYGFFPQSFASQVQ